nr:YslB family protein [Ectobacillus ponti]
MDQLQTIQMNGFAYELLRDEVLPDLMGKELDRILYWAGKSLARRYPLTSMEEIISFFEHAGWGHLLVVSENKHEMELQLSGPLITERYRDKRNHTYQLEAGFLAQQVQQLRGALTETYEEQKRRADKVVFTMKWDSKDITEA